MGLILATLASVAATVGAAAPAAVQSRACTPENVTLQIQILGDRSWGWQLGRYTAIPAKTTTIAVWSMGGPPATYGIVAYGWVTRNRSNFSVACRSGTAPQRDGRLSAPIRVKDGWNFGRKFSCIQTGRFVVEIRDISGGKRLTVRVQRTGRLLAVGEVKAGGGWLRGSPTCIYSTR